MRFIKDGDTSSGSVVAQNETTKTLKNEDLAKERPLKKTDKNEDSLKERPSKKNKKKEKENVEKTYAKSLMEKRLLVLPLEASVIAIFLLVLLGAFYVVCTLLSFLLNVNYNCISYMTDRFTRLCS